MRGFGDGKEKKVGAVLQGNVFTGEIGSVQARSQSRWKNILYHPWKSRRLQSAF